ncbi:MAG: hypothetical protein JWN44_5146 [Myxococcales bacterium]|nr:hypothetical protein [Myxococcales bacterium]
MRAASHTYIEITIDEEEVAVAPDSLDWCDEQTARFNFDKRNLTPDDRLVIGYLTMEANGMFASLSLDEQHEVARRLKR